MTYGWAILAIIIVIGVLVSLGIFSPSTYSRKFSTGFPMLGSPDDWKVESDGSFEIILKNQMAWDVTVYELNMTLEYVSVRYDTFNCTGDGTFMSIANGGIVNPEQACTSPSNPFAVSLGEQYAGDSYSVYVRILYTIGDGINHTEQGIIRGTVDL